MNKIKCEWKSKIKLLEDFEPKKKNCTKCDKILSKINFIDAQIKSAKETKDYYDFKYGYSVLYGEHRDILKMFQEKLEDSHLEFLLLQKEKAEVSMKLTKHYRNRHLDV